MVILKLYINSLLQKYKISVLQIIGPPKEGTILITLASLALAQVLNFTEFIEEVEELIQTSETYVFPVDNSAYFPDENSDDETIDYGTYDFIIVGGGTSGGILANRLTEENYTVLVLEAGDQDPFIASVLGLSTYLYHSDLNWGYKTTKQTQSCLGSVNKQCFYPRGKVLGGSSIINAGIYARGNHDDFNNWEALGNIGWSFADVLPYFKKAENASFTIDIDPRYHGFNGPQATNIVEDTPGLTSELLRAYRELGQDEVDYNGRSQDGVSRLQWFLKDNIRSSTAQAYIRPAQDRPNLHISLNSYVTKINIVSDIAEGVEFVKNKTRYFATAKNEVILSAGSINTPQVLMLSGIGPADHLIDKGIDVINDLPVGQNLVDHVHFSGVIYRTNQVFYNLSLEEDLELWTEDHRPLTPGFASQTIGFWKLNDSLVPEIEMLVIGPPDATSGLASVFGLNEVYQDVFQLLNGLTDFIVAVILLHPRSVGEVTLQSSDPREFPLINPNYLSDIQDLEIMYQGIQIALQLNNTETFRKLTVELLLLPIPDCDESYEKMSKDWWYCALRVLSSTVYHPVGTTRMGMSCSDSVVDTNLKVHGIDKLRVVDAGVMPTHISGHTNAAVVMIAEKIADVIKNEYRYRHLKPYKKPKV